MNPLTPIRAIDALIGDEEQTGKKKKERKKKQGVDLQPQGGVLIIKNTKMCILYLYYYFYYYWKISILFLLNVNHNKPSILHSNYKN